MENVKLGTFVIDVRRAKNGPHSDDMLFEVVTTSPYNDTPQETTYADYVIVVNGHNEVPEMPEWKGSETFPGKIMHSRDYRKPDEECFKNKSILVVGGSYSGIEMIVQFFAHPKFGQADVDKVFFCGKVAAFAQSTDLKPFLDSGKLVLVDSAIDKIEGAEVVFKNNSRAMVDTIIACTGYRFVFPFLKNGDDFVTVSDNGKYFGPLHKKTVCINQPQLMFAGNIDNTCFIQKILELQAMFIKHVINGDVKLPCKEDMMKGLEMELVDHHGSALKKFFRPDCAVTEDNKIINDLSADIPGSSINKEVIDALNILGPKLVEVISTGDFIRYRKMDYREFVPNFPWDVTVKKDI